MLEKGRSYCQIIPSYKETKVFAHKLVNPIHKLKIAKLLIIGLTFLSFPALTGLKAFESDDVRRIEKYLNTMNTFKSEFIQISDNGVRVDGTIFIDRPGFMRIQYDSPSPILLVADGSFLVYVDTELEQISHIPISETPLRILISKNINLEKWYSIQRVRRGLGTLEIFLSVKKDPKLGSIRLLFSDRPLQLRKWFIRDAVGATVQVSLLDIETGMRLDPELFVVDPEMFTKIEEHN